MQTAIAINQNKVYAIYTGYGETGPRALGFRSIIARADSTSIAEKISREIKKREWYRPIAPVMLDRNFSYFTGKTDYPEIARYMLAEFNIIPEKVDEIRGCVHADGTSRIQVVDRNAENPYLEDLLETLDQVFGIKCIINTSFNQQGEPIIHSKDQAMEAALCMGLDGLIVNGKAVELK